MNDKDKELIDKLIECTNSLPNLPKENEFKSEFEPIYELPDHPLIIKKEIVNPFKIKRENKLPTEEEIKKLKQFINIFHDLKKDCINNNIPVHDIVLHIGSDNWLANNFYYDTNHQISRKLNYQTSMFIWDNFRLFFKTNYIDIKFAAFLDSYVLQFYKIDITNEYKRCMNIITNPKPFIYQYYIDLWNKGLVIAYDCNKEKVELYSGEDIELVYSIDARDCKYDYVNEIKKELIK